MITGCSWSGILSYSRSGCALSNLGSPNFSNSINPIGVNAIEIVTIKVSKLACSGLKTFWLAAVLNNTKANSPPWAKVTPSRILVGKRLPNKRAITVITPNLISISATAALIIKTGWAKINFTSVNIPTDIKNRPNNNPLKGSILASNS